MKKRIFAILLCLIMCLSMIPGTVWAEGSVEDVPVEMKQLLEEESPAGEEAPVEEETSENDGDVPIDDMNFPDETFRSYVRDTFDSDENGTLYDEEIANATEIYVDNMMISSLQGIEFFPKLTVLDCYKNKLTRLDVSKNPELSQLICAENDLAELDIRTTQSCLAEKNYGFFGHETGDAVVTVLMTAEQKAIFEKCFSLDKRNRIVNAVVEKPVIITQPEDYTGETGTTATFSIDARGDGLSYQWQYLEPGTNTWKNCSQTGSKTDTLYVPIAKDRDGQLFRCKVTNSSGGIQYSNAAKLTVKNNHPSSNPKTGDDRQLILWTSFALFSGAAIAAAALKLRKKTDPSY